MLGWRILISVILVPLLIGIFVLDHRAAESAPYLFGQSLLLVWRAAFEFRHPSWFDDASYSALADRNCALCLADSGEEGDAPRVATADWGYLRLRREAYDEAG